MSRYNRMDERSGEAFDANTCKRYPEGTAAALTITPVAGGTRSVSAHLTIVQLQ